MAGIDVPTREADAAVSEELERFEREMKLHQKRVERGRKIAEGRGRIMVMLAGLARYESHYEGIRAYVEDQWQPVK